MASGSSLEFSDYREYAAGDDLRRVDWNGFARFGKLYLKLFLEEKQASVHVFLDCSRSMEQDGKFLAAKKLAASFAYVGLCGGDQVHLFAFGDTLRAQKRNLAQKGRFLETVDFLDKLEAVGGTDSLFLNVRKRKKVEQISGSLGKNRGSVEEILQERSEILIFF